MVQEWTQNTPGVPDSAQANDQFGASLISGNFNGDNFADLAIGVPFEDLATPEDVGAVHILRGAGLGLVTANNQYVHQNRLGVLDIAEESDLFGSSLAAGDFNSDGYDDLVVGVSGENNQSGAVQVFRGSNAGLSLTTSQLWSQNSAGVDDSAEANDGFGSNLAVGDFNQDGYDDLAVGIPFERIGTLVGAGAIAVLRGSVSGLTGSNDQFLHQNSPDIAGDAETGDLFGSELAAGDFNGDGYDDLAVGAYLEDVGNLEDAGVVHVLRGSGAGLVAPGDELWYQNRPGVAGDAEAGDGFGSELAAGDFNNDGYDDLVVSATGEEINGRDAAGAVHVFRGSRVGITATGSQLWHGDVAGLEGEAIVGARFGSNLAVGDFNGDNYDDLVISSFGVNELLILRGSNSGLSTTRNLNIFVEGVYSLGVGDFNNDGYDDLAIGCPQTSIGAASAAGTTYILFGSNSGLQ